MVQCYKSLRARQSFNILGVQHGNTSEPVARRLKDEGRIAEVRTYAYHDIGAMLDDLAAGKIGGVMKLAPVMHWMIRGRPRLRVVQEQITDEMLGIAVRLGDDALREAVNDAQARLQDSGALPQLVKKWLQALSVVSGCSRGLMVAPMWNTSTCRSVPHITSSWRTLRRPRLAPRSIGTPRRASNSSLRSPAR